MTIQDHYFLSTLDEVKVLSEKSTGCISLVLDNVDNRLYVQKIFTTKNGLAAHRTRQALRHKNLPEIHHIVEDESGYALIEDYIHGKSLTQRIGNLTENEAGDYFIQLCEVLTFLHNQPMPIIHRDIKPPNILITDDGIVKLIDFDAAKEYKPHKHEDTVLMGTKAYAAPEQHGYAVTDTRTDIYSLGATMYHVLAGTCYNYATGFDKYQGKFLPIIKKCVQIDPENRYPSVRTLQDDIIALSTEYTLTRDLRLFPDLHKVSGGRRNALIALYVILALFLLHGMFTILFNAIFNNHFQFNFILTLFVMYIAPHVIISNFLSIRNRIPIFHQKGPGLTVAWVSIVFFTLLGMYLSLEIIFNGMYVP